MRWWTRVSRSRWPRRSRWPSATWRSSRCVLASGCRSNGRWTRRPAAPAAAAAAAAPGGKRRQARCGAQRQPARRSASARSAGAPGGDQGDQHRAGGAGPAGTGWRWTMCATACICCTMCSPSSRCRAEGRCVPGAHGNSPRSDHDAQGALIVDDEALARARMRTLLGDCTVACWCRWAPRPPMRPRPCS
jgi:hypothetical protein